MTCDLAESDDVRGCEGGGGWNGGGGVIEVGTGLCVEVLYHVTFLVFSVLDQCVLLVYAVTPTQSYIQHHNINESITLVSIIHDIIMCVLRYRKHAALVEMNNYYKQRVYVGLLSAQLMI